MEQKLSIVGGKLLWLQMTLAFVLTTAGIGYVYWIKTVADTREDQI